MLVELFDDQGTHRRASLPTGADGNYNLGDAWTLGGGVAAKTWFIKPVIGRTQASLPAQHSIRVDNVTDTTPQNFRIRGVPGRLTVTSAPRGTFVLLTPNSTYPGDRPPDTNPTSNSFSAVVNESGSVEIPVPPGSTYSITCWVPMSSATGVTYEKSAGTSLMLTTVSTVAPNSTHSVRCPEE